MIALLLAKKIFSFFMIMFLAGVLVKTKILKSGDSIVVSRVLIYLVTPCMILSAFQVDATPEVRNSLLLSVTAAAILLFLSIAAAAAGAKLFRMDSVEQASVIYSNCGNLIIPIVASILGPEWQIFTFGFLSVQIFLLWTHCKALLCGDKKPDIRSIVTNNNLVMVIIGVCIFFSGYRFPPVIKDTLDSLGGMIGPLSMIVTGMLLADQNLKEILSYRRIWIVTAFRLLVIPLISLAFLKYSGLAKLVPDGEIILLISLLAAISPTATLVTQMAQLYGKDAKYASSINVVTTLLCIATMPVMVYLYQL